MLISWHGYLSTFTRSTKLVSIEQMELFIDSDSIETVESSIRGTRCGGILDLKSLNVIFYMCFEKELFILRVGIFEYF